MKIGLKILFTIALFSNLFSKTAEKIETSIASTILNKEVKLSMIVPQDMNSNNSYPVLYLLHGLGGDNDDWIEATNILSYAEDYKFIIVMPDAGKSWYLDSPVVPESQYETFFIKELVPFIDSRHRVAENSYRGICGTSMGGHGAVMLALRHPEVFDAASSLSGVLDISAHSSWGGIWGLDSLLNTYVAIPENWLTNSCYHQLKFSPRFELFFDCGDMDPFVLEDNRRFAARCDSLGIDHIYEEYSGGHNWTAWDSRIEKHLQFHQQMFQLSSVKQQEISFPSITVWPNPFNSTVTITFEDNFSNLSVSIYNCFGRKIKSWREFDRQNTIHWNGTDDAGRQVSSGLYFVSIETPAGIKAVKLNYVK